MGRAGASPTVSRLSNEGPRPGKMGQGSVARRACSTGDCIIWRGVEESGLALHSVFFAGMGEWMEINGMAREVRGVFLIVERAVIPV